MQYYVLYTGQSDWNRNTFEDQGFSNTISLAAGGQQNEACPHSRQDYVLLEQGAFLLNIFQNCLSTMISTEMKQISQQCAHFTG